MESHALWRFAVDRYAVEGVAPRCLALQDEHGLDVNVVFACLFWATRSSVPLREAQLRTLLDAAQHERAWVTTVRSVRRAVKERSGEHPRYAALYATLKSTELLAEKVEQGVLLDALGSGDGGGGDARAVALASLRAYASVAGADGADAGLGELVELVL